MGITVAIVDDHHVVREGLAALLATDPGLDVVGTAGTGAEAVALCRERTPDVVLLDLILDQETGVEVLPRLKTASPASRVIMLTSYAEGDLVEPALSAGADGYLLKTTSAAGVLDAVRRVAAGESVIDAAATDAAQALGGNDLSVREREVLHLVAEGLSNREIAERLTITVRTVKAHISSLLEKLHLNDRTQLAIYALHQRMGG